MPKKRKQQVVNSQFYNWLIGPRRKGGLSTPTVAPIRLTLGDTHSEPEIYRTPWPRCAIWTSRWP